MMRMVTAEGRGYASKGPAKPEPPKASDRTGTWMMISYVLLLIGGPLGLHRLYNRQPVFAFAQALFSVYILIDFGTWTSLYLAILLVAWLISDAFQIPKWVAARAG
jgi:TM2 domain-containing membrane protein YozV